MLVSFKKIILVVPLLFCFTVKAYDSKCLDRKTSQLAILKTNLLPIDLDNPEEDFRRRINYGDFRFLSINEFGVVYPSLRLPRDKDILYTAGEKNIEGTSDGSEGEEHEILIIKFGEYAVLYNYMMKVFLDECSRTN